MPERDANQLAADVSAGIEAILNGAQERAKARLALAELVALVGTLQQERDTLENRWLDDNARAVAAEGRLEGVEAKLAEAKEQGRLQRADLEQQLRDERRSLATTRQALAKALFALEEPAPLFPDGPDEGSGYGL